MKPMQMTPALLLVFLVMLARTGLAASDPLFESNDLLEIRLAAPLTTLMRERPDDEELDGSVAFSGDSGSPVTLSVEIRTRGNYRRQERICQFAPLRLDFRKSEVEGTLFDGQDKLKLVTHCRNAMKYEQAAIREYLVYRMFNLLSDLSYRVRPLRITYVDTEKDGRENTRFGFVIEHRERFAARTGLAELEVPAIEVDALDPAYASLVDVFQYLVGNTDYSPVRGADGEDCCHNINLFGGGDAVFAVPYDFDMSGMVDSMYSSPNPALGLRSTRERLFRGRCAHSAELDAALDTVREQRDALYALVDAQLALTKSSRKGMERFLNSFFAMIDKPKSVTRELVEACAAP